MKAKYIALFITFNIITISIYTAVEANPGVKSADSVASHKSSLYGFCRESKFLRSYSDVEKVLFSTPLAFTKNMGQIENYQVHYYIQGDGIWFTDDGVWFEKREEISINSQESRVQGRESKLLTDDQTTSTYEYKSVRFKQEFIGCNNVKPIGKGKLSWNSNYFYGNDSTKWCTNVPNYQEIFYENLYDGIDLRYYSTEKNLKYDFIVHPGAEVKQIRIRCNGASNLVVEAQKSLKIKTSIGEIVDRNLKIYQLENNKEKTINGAFRKYNEFEYGFEIFGSYDKYQPLVIDPILDYSTFFGGGSTESCKDIDVDSSGNVYVTGFTYSSNFPITNGSYDETKSNKTDSYIFKLAHNGSELFYSTFIGGVNQDYSNGIKIDNLGNSYITGTTLSYDFPTTPNAYDTTANNSMNVFVVKLNPQGSKLEYSTFIHGTNSSGDQGYDIDIDGLGNAYVTGVTYSKDFPTTIGSYDTGHNNGSDVFVLKLNRTGQRLIFSTFVGGKTEDIAYGIAVENNGNAYVTGGTDSSDFPTTTDVYDSVMNGSLDCFVFKLISNGSSIEFSTFIGGDATESGYSIAVNSKGYPVISGETYSSNFPTTNGVIDTSYNGLADSFVLKLNKDGKSLIFSTFIGGNGIDQNADLALDSSENICITGETTSADFPKSFDAYNTNIQGYDAFLMKLTPDASNIIYSTYMGGWSSDGGSSLAVDSANSVYVLGTTTSSDFPTTTGAYDDGYTGNRDGIIFKFSFNPILTINSVSILRNSTPTSVVYSKLPEYTFRINLIHSANHSDFQDVNLILDPNGINIRLKWDYTTRQFTKENDPKQFVYLEPSSKDSNINQFWTIDFDIIFDWHYPNENFTQVQIFATSLSLPDVWLNLTKFYRVENDLEFNGTLFVTDEKNQTVLENNLIRAGTKLNWTGLKVVYQNTSDVYPTSKKIQIEINDSSGHNWFASNNPGEEFFIQTITISESNINGETYYVNISGIPKECDASNISVNIRVDGDNVTFSDIIPIENTWQTKQKVFVSVNISDPGGEVDSRTVSRSISTDNGSSWGEWIKIYGLESNKSISVQNAVTFIEGTQNLLKWSAMDIVGNGPTESQPIRIKVDTKPVSFSKAWPTHEVVSTNENVELKITITDNNSGVDASSIYYKIYDNSIKLWSDWIQITGYKDGPSINIRINHTFLNGSNNMVKWRATDIAGNDPRESSYYIVNVDTWQPTIKPRTLLLSPINGHIVNRTNIELRWELVNRSTVGTTYDLYLDTSTPPGLNITGIIETQIMINDLKDNVVYFWYVIPKLKNDSGVCSNGIWSFKIQLDIKNNDSNDDKDFYDVWISGPKELTLYAGENATIELNITNLGIKNDTFLLEIEANALTGYFVYDNKLIEDLNSKSYALRPINISIPKHVEPDIYEVIITATSIGSGYLVKKDHLISIEIKARNGIDNNNSGIDNNTGGNGSSGEESKYNQGIYDIMFYFILAVILIIIIILIVASVVLKRKKHVEQQILEHQTVTIKPRTSKIPISVQPTIAKTDLITNVPSNAQLNSIEQTSIPLTPSPTIEQPQKIQPKETKLQIPQVAKSPQLPPANTTEKASSTKLIAATTSTTSIQSPIPDAQMNGQKTSEKIGTGTSVQQTNSVTINQASTIQSQPQKAQELPQQEKCNTGQPKEVVQNNKKNNNDT